MLLPPFNFIEVTVLLPLRGGAPHNSYITSASAAAHLPSSSPLAPSETPVLPTSAAMQEYLPSSTTLRIATWNLNGCFRNSNSASTNSIWEYVKLNRIDLLFLIDHRSDTTTLKFMRRQASTHLSTDVSLCCAPVHAHSLSTSSQSEWSASAGGVAILAFGSISPYLQNTTTLDPSGTGTFLSTILRIKNHPPIALIPLYLFPQSTGDTTINKRIQHYLNNNGILTSPTAWQREQLSTTLHLIRQKYEDCTIILGGDFNTSNFSSQTTAMYRHCDLTNLALQTSKPVSTFATATDSPKWLDHFLYSNDVTLVNHHADYPITLSSTSLSVISDHTPYFNEINLQRTLDINHSLHNLYHKANQLNKTYDIAPTSHLAEKFTDLIGPKLAQLATPFATLASHEEYYNKVMKLISTTAKGLHPKLRHKKWDGWSPTAQLYHNYYQALKHTKRRITRNTPHLASKVMLTFYNEHNHYKNNDNTYRYRELLQSLLLSDDPSSPLSQLISEPTVELLNTTIEQITRLNHYANRAIIRERISIHCAKQQDAVRSGRTSQPINSLLNKPRREGIQPIRDIEGQPYTDMHALNTDINTHFTNHFSTRSEWIKSTGMDSNTELSQQLHDSLLNGTWRTHITTLLHTLPHELQDDAAVFFDTCRIKATATAQQELETALSQPITLEEFTQALHSKHGGTSPGPSGVTINHLKLLPDIALANLHSTLQYFYKHHHVPHLWKQRIMTLIPKNEDPQSLNQYRPIMLLDDTRKLWLSILKRRRDPILYKYQLLNRSQCGGISHAGTEDAILAAVNCIEDSHERNTELHITVLDKQRAFDAPRRRAAINLAWRRMGLSKEQANYTTSLDEDNEIFAKTPQFLLHPQDTPSFQAEGGSSQGDTDATFNYNVVDDITLDYLDTLKHEQDYYHFKSSQSTLVPQHVTQFIDDTHIYSSSVKGAQRTLDLYRLSGLLLNIYNNPLKFHHIPLMWTGSSLLQPTASLLQAHDENLFPQTIPITPVNQLTRFLGAYISSDNLPEHNLTRSLNLAASACSTLYHKKAAGNVISSVVYSSVYPSLSYPLQFTNLSVTQLNQIASPLHRLIQHKNHLHDFSHSVIFNHSSTPYGMHHRNFTQYVNSNKFSLYRRMSQGSQQSREIIHSLMARAMRYRGAWDDPSPHPTTIPQPPLVNLPKPLPTWASSLLDWLKPVLQPQLHFPQHSSKLLTHTDIISLLIPSDNITPDQLHSYLSEVNLFYLEELYTTTTTSNLDHHNHLLSLTKFLPPTISQFIKRIYRTGLHMNITPASTTIRSDMFLHTHPNTIQIVHPTTNNLVALTRQWPTKNISIKKWQSTQYRMIPELVSTIPTTRLLTYQIDTKTTHKIKSMHLQQNIYIPKSTQTPSPYFHFPPALLASLPQTGPLLIYTDGSFTQHHSTPGLQIPTPATTSLSLIITTQPLTPDTNAPFITLTVTGPTFLSNSYQAELLAASAAASLSTTSRPIHIITDCKSVVTQIHRLRNPNAHIPRTDITHYLQLILSTSATLTHVKAHSDLESSIPTTHQWGNQIADAFARNIATPAWAHPPSHTFNKTLSDFLPSHQHHTTLHSDQSTILPSSHALSKHLSQIRINSYITNRHTTYYQHHAEWLNYTWTATGLSFRKLLKGEGAHSSLTISNLKASRYFFKTLYDKFRNHAYIYKIQHPRPHAQDQSQTDLPTCPLCLNTNDSITHLFCHCTHPTIMDLRTSCLQAITSHFTIFPQSSLPFEPFVNALTSNDSRAWACLLPLHSSPQKDFTTTAAHILPFTLSTVYNMWKEYNTITHIPQTTLTQSTSHTILSRTARVIRVKGPRPQTQSYNPPKASKPITRSRDIRPFLVAVHHPTSPTTWITPTRTSPVLTDKGTNTVPLHNRFTQLSVEETTHTDNSNYNFPPPPLTPVNNPRAILPFQASSPPSAIQHFTNVLHFTRTRVNGDGDCLLHSIKASLNNLPQIHNPLVLEPTYLRHRIHKFLTSTQGRDIYNRHFLTREMIDSILPTLTNRGSWLEQFAIEALQEILNINITTYFLFQQRDRHYSSTMERLNHQNGRPTVTILHHDNNHFSSLHPFDPP